MRDYVFRYSLKMSIVAGYVTPCGWATRSRAGCAIAPYLAGKPTPTKLAQYVADYNASLGPGGVNAHLGERCRCEQAVILDGHNNNAVVATWKETA